jgi:adenylate cyclase
MVREMGGHGFVAYAVIGDTVNTASRLEGQAPVGGVLIGERTRELLPDGTRAEPVTDVRVKGKEATLDAFLLQALP